MGATYSIQGINLFEVLSIKNLRTVLTGKVVHSTPQEIHLQLGENSFLSVYRFGCLVFFNVPPDVAEKETQIVRDAFPTGLLSAPTTETYSVVVEDKPLNVEFEYVELKKLTPDHVRLINFSVAQSAALEYFEVRVDKMLYDTSNFMEALARVGSVPLALNKLIKMIGSTASTRQNIISNLSILDPPDETWKSKELEKLHKELQQNFDLEVRFRTLDRKLSLIQNNNEILTDLASSRRATTLEVLIILLIAFEVGWNLLHH